jgi:hypothetical protein
VTARIVFNGQEYASREAMPEDVRRAYDEVLATLRDADADGIPDVFEGGNAHPVIGVQQSSLTFNGRTLTSAGELPWTDDTQPLGTDREGLDSAQIILGVFLAFMAGFVLVLGVVSMLAIGGGREHLAGRLAVAIVALLLLGWFDTQATRLAMRRQPLLAPNTPGYRRFQVWSGLGLLLAAGLLLGLAWYLP